LPISEHIDRQARLVRFTATGVLETDEFIAVVDRAVAAVGTERGWGILSDHRDLEVPATAEQIRALLERVRSHGAPLHGSRWAVLPASLASYGMMRMLAALAESVPLAVHIATTEDEAMRWLATER
jgi:hypothetical protein